MRLLTHIVSPEQEGWPLRRLLRQELRISGSFLSRLKWRPGAILVNGRPATVAAVLHTGDAVTADVSDLPGDNPHIRPVAWPLDILWEDEDLLVLNKPAGIAIHPAALTEETVTVAGAVCHYLGQGSFHCVNRLDRGTTGVMVVAKTGYVHRLCMEQLHSGDFRRTYLAVCSGVPSPAAGSIDLPIGREPDSLLRRRVDPAGLAAHTDYETLWAGAGPGPAAADPRHRPHPPAAAAPVRHWPPPAGGLALRHRGPNPDPPPGPALPPAGADPPRHPPPPDGNSPAAGGYGPAPAGRYEQILKNAKKGWKF